MANQSKMADEDGATRRKRPESRVLVRWNGKLLQSIVEIDKLTLNRTDEIDRRLLLMIDSTCKEEGVKLPWTKIAAALGPKFSEGAIIQHLAKMRNKVLEADRIARATGDKTCEANVMPLTRPGRKHVLEDDNAASMPTSTLKRGKFSNDQTGNSTGKADTKKANQKNDNLKSKMQTTTTEKTVGIKQEAADGIDDAEYTPPSTRTRGVKKDYTKWVEDESDDDDEEKTKQQDAKAMTETSESGSATTQPADLKPEDGMDENLSDSSSSRLLSRPQSGVKQLPESSRKSLIVKLPVKLYAPFVTSNVGVSDDSEMILGDENGHFGAEVPRMTPTQYYPGTGVGNFSDITPFPNYQSLGHGHSNFGANGFDNYYGGMANHFSTAPYVHGGPMTPGLMDFNMAMSAPGYITPHPTTAGFGNNGNFSFGRNGSMDSSHFSVPQTPGTQINNHHLSLFNAHHSPSGVDEKDLALGSSDLIDASNDQAEAGLDPSSNELPHPESFEEFMNSPDHHDMGTFNQSEDDE